MRTITLGDLIAGLNTISPETPLGEPCGKFASWRGSYDELTITHGDSIATAGELLNAAMAANGACFEGYKGGSYRMGLNTPVWADDYGCYSQYSINGVLLRGGKAHISITIRDD